jgi:cytochrome c biogenesis protein CcmG, thiol:disulfide interchange protein DsbE
MHLKRILPLLIFVLFAGIMATALWQKQQPQMLPQSPLLGQAMPALSLQVLASGAAVPSAAFTQITVVNIFASWCGPCIAELPELKKLAIPGVHMVGISWHDTPEKIAAWVTEYQPPFDAIWHDPSNQIGVALGLRGIPETLIVDQRGIIRAHIQGPIDTHVVTDVLLPLLLELRHDA